MERQHQPSDDRPPLEHTHKRPLPQKFSEELVASIRETISKQALPESSDESLHHSLAQIAARHADKEVTDLCVATEIVQSIATLEFPNSKFHSSIDRLSGDIAAMLLADPFCRDQLVVLWNSLRERTD